ncbi:MAG: hypothetical protein FWC38_00655 [Proteobacteria bacterium]|nr:hypothetical protein [Pseudomonadota bacterium]MCL2306752.1 hypothetical protein [Pseudomonadota bacterium]
MKQNHIATLYIVYGAPSDPTMTREEYDLTTMSWDDAVMAARNHARKIRGVISALITTPVSGFTVGGKDVPLTKVFRPREIGGGAAQSIITAVYDMSSDDDDVLCPGPDASVADWEEWVQQHSRLIGRAIKGDKPC